MWRTPAREENDFIQLGNVTSLFGNFNVAAMNRVKTASEDCNFLFQGGVVFLGDLGEFFVVTILADKDEHFLNVTGFPCIG